MRDRVNIALLSIMAIGFAGAIMMVAIAGLEDRITRLERSDARASNFISKLQTCANSVLVAVPSGGATRMCQP